MDDDDTIPDGPSNLDKSEDERTEYEAGTMPEPETQKFLSPSSLNSWKVPLVTGTVWVLASG